jgi:hypothetical protein
LKPACSEINDLDAQIQLLLQKKAALQQQK